MHHQQGLHASVLNEKAMQSNCSRVREAGGTRERCYALAAGSASYMLALERSTR